MVLGLESKLYKMDTEVETDEVTSAFNRIQEYLDSLFSIGNEVGLSIEVDSGDMHNGQEDNPIVKKVVSSLDIHEVFQRFFDMGHYNFNITVRPDNTGFKIETDSTYNLSSAWVEQRVEVFTVSPREYIYKHALQQYINDDYQGAIETLYQADGIELDDIEYVSDYKQEALSYIREFKL